MMNISHKQLFVLCKLVDAAIELNGSEDELVESTTQELESIKAGLHVYLKDAARLEEHDRQARGYSM